jgi:hypothetical protein
MLNQCQLRLPTFLTSNPSHDQVIHAHIMVSEKHLTYVGPWF